MPIFDKPNLTRAFASAANPADVIDPDDGELGKYAAGWQAELPPYEYFNSLQNSFSRGLAHINQHGIALWDDETEYPVNGLTMAGNGQLYRAVQQNVAQEPTASPLSWAPFLSATPLITYIDTSGEFIPQASTRQVEFTAVGGGGSGGGTPNCAADQSCAAGGGGGAGVAQWTGAPWGPYTIVIGAEGSPGAVGGGDGGDGGSTTVSNPGGSITATGGKGGKGASGITNSGVRYAPGGDGGGGEGEPLLTVGGSAGAFGTTIPTGGGSSITHIASFGTGGANYIGGHPRRIRIGQVIDADDPLVADLATPGVGGHGSCGIPNYSGIRGGKGAPGLVRIIEWT